MGDVNVTVTNMKVVDVDVENNIIALKGSVPGSREGFLELRESAAGSKNKKA
jgi:large subunit ribosomal protein L3